MLITALLIFFGLLTLSSATAVKAYEETGNSYFFVRQQILRGFLPGLFAFLVLIRLPYQWLKKGNWLWLAATYFLLLIVFVPGLSLTINGSQSWLVIGGVAVQTSEIAKLTFIIYLALWFESKHDEIRDLKKTFIPFILLTGSVCFLLMLQPDMGTMAIFFSVSLLMYLTAGMKLTHLALVLSGAGAIFAALIKIAPYRLQRLLTFINPDNDPLGAGYQVKQALIAIGSGGLFGVGLGQSRQKFDYLPEVAADSIFAVFAEEWGFFVSIIFVLLYALLFLRGQKIAKRSKDLFAKLLVTGIIGWITIQSLVNIGAISGILPLTGLPLPFVSLGGSNLAVVMAAMAIVLGISRQSTVMKQ